MPTSVNLCPIVHSKKTDPWQQQLVGWYERRPLHDPNKVSVYWSKKKTTMFGAKMIVLLGYCVLFPAAAVWTQLCVAAQSTSFLLLSIFRLHGCHFSGWGSPVGGFLISETSIFTINNGDEARKGRTTAPWCSPPNRQRRSAFKKARLLWQKKSQESPFIPAQIGFFLLSSSLHRTSAVAVQSHRRLALARRTWEWYMYDAHLQRTLACGWKGKTTDFRAKKRKAAFPRWNILEIEIRWKCQCPFALLHTAHWKSSGMGYHWRRAIQLETFGRNHSRTFSVCCSKANGHWHFHLTSPYFSALRQLALVNQ